MKMPKLCRWLHWYQTYSGRKFNPLKARPSDIYIEDIAHALAQICRYGGHCKYFYSVAQHSVLCARYAPGPFKFLALMHDATEAYIGDMVTPLKNQMPEFHRVEDRLWEVIAKRYRLPVTLPADVKVIDRQSLATERRDLLDNSRRLPWKILEGISPWSETINTWSPETSEKRFLRWFNYLYPMHLAQELKYGSTKKHSRSGKDSSKQIEVRDSAPRYQGRVHISMGSR